jgi:hypothetical protein
MHFLTFFVFALKIKKTKACIKMNTQQIFYPSSLPFYKNGSWLCIFMCIFFVTTCAQENKNFEHFLYTPQMSIFSARMTEAQKKACVHKAELLYQRLKASGFDENDIEIAIKHEILKEYYVLVEQKKSDAFFICLNCTLPTIIVMVFGHIWKR